MNKGGRSFELIKVSFFITSFQEYLSTATFYTCKQKQGVVHNQTTPCEIFQITWN